MRKPLTPVGDALQAIVPGIAPVPARTIAMADAAGAWLAEPLIVLAAVPTGPLALRTGLAVSSLEVAGASAQSPVMLARAPKRVAAGEALEAPSDAVIDEDAVTTAGAMHLVAETVSPGGHARLRGQDAAAGAVLMRSGQHLTPQAVLGCRLAGIDTASVRVAAISLAVDDAAQCEWLRRSLSALGCEIVAEGAACHLRIVTAHSGEPRLALQPGDTAWIARSSDGGVRIEVPWRFDGLIAAYAALVLPVLAKLLGLTPRAITLPLERKIASQIGMTELALLELRETTVRPLAVGDITLSAVASADAFALIPALSEGHAAGEPVVAIAFQCPFGPSD